LTFLIRYFGLAAIECGIFKITGLQNGILEIAVVELAVKKIPL